MTIVKEDNDYYCDFSSDKHLFDPDVLFPTLQSGLTRMPQYQSWLFDGDDTSCIAVGTDFMAGQKHQSLILHWDPADKNSPRDNVATYHCQTEFFVNITHGHDVGISVYRNRVVLDETNIVGQVLEYQKCPLIGQSTIQGLVRSKFMCQCTAKCNVMINTEIPVENTESDDRICTLKIY